LRILFLSLFIASLAAAEVVEKIVAIVNDEVITLTDIKRYESRLRAKVSMDELVSQGLSPKELLSDRSKLVGVLVDEKVLDSEVKKQNLSITVERVEKEIRNISKANRMSRAQLKQALQNQGMDFAEYQNMIKTRLERQSLIEKNLTSNIRVSDEEVQSHLGAQGSPNEIAEYTIAHILIKSDKKRAEGILKKLQDGKSFEQLAADNSEDPNFQNGGRFGTFSQGEMVKEIETAVKKMKVGDTSGLVKTKMGYHILKLTDKKVISNPVAQEQTEKVRSMLSQKAFQRQFRIWLDQRKQEAFIRVNKI
jgi:peptidyl-prolyl cis-trans isomerase SurA